MIVNNSFQKYIKENKNICGQVKDVSAEDTNDLYYKCRKYEVTVDFKLLQYSLYNFEQISIKAVKYHNIIGLYRKLCHNKTNFDVAIWA